ncbi:MAG: Mth938-like domain-containing protein [Mizugakiibacter sp.]|uniref:Mth938-like domain-containing protein n=1 Tax=Mizugakiibacter sp. TaxID=1972610 RepID=UPI0031CBA9A1|nr:Mth938-like domain-containing protein [Xanthomonadaceae bacterium]
MELNLERPGEYLFVRRGDAHSVTVVDHVLTRSFVLARETLIEDWPVADVQAIDEAQLAPIFALQPEVVLLGTGARQRFPAQAIVAAFLQRRVGVEVMDNAAASRTYNVLASEGRHVVAAFILE